MNRINLLPLEFRATERTPLPMLFGILGGVLFLTLILFVFLYCRMVRLPQAEGQLRERRSEKKMRALRAKEFDRLKADEAVYTGVDRLVRQIESRRNPWAVYLKDLVEDMAAAEKANKDFKMWISDLRFEGEKDMGRSGKDRSGKIRFDFEIAGTGGELYHDLIQALKRHGPDRALHKNILDLSPPDWRTVSYEDYLPGKAVQFRNFKIILKPKK